MSDQNSIPVLTDLIERGIEITMEDLGLDDGVAASDADSGNTIIDITDADAIEAGLFADNPALEQTIRRILDEHMELAWQEIKLAIQRELEK